MASFRFLHAADVHLDSPLRGLARYDEAPVDRLRAATRHAFERLVTLAIEQEVELVVLAGDLYDGDWRNYETGLFFVRQMQRLADRDIPVVVLHGNHDAQSRITKRLTLPGNVHVLPAVRPGSIGFESLGAVVHGQSFAKQKVEENLVPSYPDAVAGSVNIGVLHTALEGDAAHATYAPCKLEELQNKGYDYWALGHVHHRQILSADPWVAFPGNVQGRHAREAGAKGCLIVDVRDGRIEEPVFHAVDVVRWAVLSVDVDDVEELDELVGRFGDALDAAIVDAEGRLLVVRAAFTGATPIHDSLHDDPESLRAELTARIVGSGEEICLEKVVVATRLPAGGGDDDSGRGSLLDQLRLTAPIESGDLEVVAEAESRLSGLLGKLPPSIKEDLEQVDAEASFEEARGILRARLGGGREA